MVRPRSQSFEEFRASFPINTGRLRLVYLLYDLFELPDASARFVDLPPLVFDFCNFPEGFLIGVHPTDDTFREAQNPACSHIKRIGSGEVLRPPVEHHVWLNMTA